MKTSAPMSAVSEVAHDLLLEVIRSVYPGDVSRVIDEDGNPPNEWNNFLMDPSGNEFNGVFMDGTLGRIFRFRMWEEEGHWSIRY